MKTKKIFSIVFAALLFTFCFGQVGSPSPISYKESSRILIKDVNLTVEDFLAKGEIAEAAKHIKNKMSDCLELGDGSKLCEAGLNFTSGYLYQQAALKDTNNTNAYKKRALVYYEKVLAEYPDNKAAWSNFIQLIEEQGIDPSTIAKLEGMAKKYPSIRLDIYVRIGDIYKNDNNLQKACDYYQKAYAEDPFSEKACGAMVALYTRYDFSCVVRNNIRQLALDCQEIDLPNYSEELLKKELVTYFNNKKYKKALESLVLWAHVMADNNWLSSKKINRLKIKLFQRKESETRAENTIYSALNELQSIIEAKQIEDIGDIRFWNGYSPEIYMSGEWSKINPESVLYKVYHTKGKKAYFKGYLKDAEAFWQAGLDGVRNSDRAFYTVVASDMAQLYNNNPRLDPSDKKLNKLIIRLFNMKGAAYGDNDLRMIRKYHITLGGIFYDKKKWDGPGGANAKFQLSRAVSSRIGPIVNPKLRRMLGDVYNELNQDSNAINAYTKSVEDYLSLDLIKDADKLMGITKEKFSTAMNSNQLKKINGIQIIIDWRKETKDPNNDLLKNKVTVTDYLGKVSKAENDAKKAISEKFVKLQFFKGLSDLGAAISDDRKVDKQIVLANALERIDKVYQLSSPTDFNRIKNIKVTLEQSVAQSKRLENAQMNKKADISYRNSQSKSGFKTYSVTALNKEIVVPDQLFELKGILKAHYATNQFQLENKVKIEMLDGKFKVKN
ncbi:tetratricopeptide repeat protein [Aquimarina rubra]|uniref:Tetratricopeptide repeat protein n=1 Tax=Aquimarina rubra TaxID=1920033 RepID=A0ABW5LE11_9FLAO